MNVTKCDLCKKAIKDNADAITAGVGVWIRAHQLCMSCGKPVKDFLVKKKLITEEGNKTEKAKKK